MAGREVNHFKILATNWRQEEEDLFLDEKDGEEKSFFSAIEGDTG